MTQNSKRTAGASKNAPGRATLRLLAALAEADVYGYLIEEGGAPVLALAASRKGISLRTGKAPPAAAKELTDHALAQWDVPGRSGRKRLTLTPEGRAKAARLAAFGDIDPFLAQHKTLVSDIMNVGDARQSVTRDHGESPLAWLASRKGRDGKALIAPSSFQAGERLRADMTLANMLPRVTSNWASPISGGRRANGPDTYSDHVIAARQRINLALGAAGPELAGLLIDVCGFLKGLELVEQERGWPARSAKVVLVIALARLARHYGLAEAAVGPKHSAKILHWGTEDYRPVIG